MNQQFGHKCHYCEGYDEDCPYCYGSGYFYTSEDNGDEDLNDERERNTEYDLSVSNT